MGRKKPRKVRVEFRKNREKRRRQNDVTKQTLETGIDEADYKSSERISGKGDLSRKRTIITDGDSEDVLREIDISDCLPGVVVSHIGLNSVVETKSGDRFECTTRRVLRTIARDARNVVVTGDRVFFRPEGEPGQGVIERVEPRHGTISRESGKREHIIVSNIDQVLIVASADNPAFKPHLVDRFLIAAEAGEVAGIVCINKSDLATTELLEPWLELYASLGYEPLLTSTQTGDGIDRLKSLMQDRQTVLAGQSGVGKSSLLNAMQPGLGRQVGGVSDWTRKGKHTTRRAELLTLEFGGWVVDTPGIRQMELWDVRAEDLEALLIEFPPFVPLCKFPDCTHSHESRCAVQAAVDSGEIHPNRYESYLRLLEELQAP